MFGIVSPVKTYVRTILIELQKEIERVEAERDLMTAKTLRIVFDVVKRTMLD
jgi:hypothetical protein